MESTPNIPAEEMAAKVLEGWGKDDTQSSIELPSSCQPNQVVRLQFRKKDEPIIATVRGVHFFIGKVKYDLGLWLGDGTVDDPEYETRIYNVDSVFVTPV